jgi:hypothetical protein
MADVTAMPRRFEIPVPRAIAFPGGQTGVHGAARSARPWRPQLAQTSRTGRYRVRYNRGVFNVGGNTYRLVVEIQYRAGIVWVKFVGTHAQYDRIDVETVNDHQADPQR